MTFFLCRIGAGELTLCFGYLKGYRNPLSENFWKINTLFFVTKQKKRKIFFQKFERQDSVMYLCILNIVIVQAQIQPLNEECLNKKKCSEKEVYQDSKCLNNK